MKYIQKKSVSLVCVALGFFLVSSVSAQVTNCTVTVKAGPVRQSFSGFGASCWPGYWNTLGSVSPVSRNTMVDMVFHDLKASTLRLWVTAGDGVTMSSMLSDFNAQYVTPDGSLNYAIKDIKNRGVTTLLLAPCDFPNEYHVPHEPVSVADYTSNLAEFILQLKNTYHITIDETGLFNEPEGLWSRTKIIEGGSSLRTALDSRGLTTVKIVAPESASHTTGSETLAYLAGVPASWNATTAIGSHSYDMIADDKLDQLRNGKPWWVTEAGDGTTSELGSEDDMRGSSIVGRFLSEVNHGTGLWIYQIGFGEAPNAATYDLNTSFLTMYDRNTSSILTFLKYYYLKQALSTMDVGAIFRKCVNSIDGEMYKVGSQNPALSAAAAYNPDGSWGINVVNQTDIPSPVATSTNQYYPFAYYNVTISVEELATTPSKTFTVYRTKSGTHFVNSGTVTFVNGTATLGLGAKEMVSLRSAATAAAIPPAPNGLTATNYSAPVYLVWNNTVKATSWKVKRATASGGPYTTIGTPSTTCYSDTTGTNGTTYYYVVSAVNASGESANSAQVFSSPATNPWTNLDIGRTGSEVIGSHKISDNGTFTVKSGGAVFADYSGTPDKCNFVYRSMTGDGFIIAHLAGGTHSLSTYGVMMRETLAGNSKATGVYYDYGAWLHTAFWARGATGGPAYNTGAVATPPTWFKLDRVGNVFTGYTSSDGSNWTMITSATISMASTISVGLSTASTNVDEYTYGTYDYVSALPPTGLSKTVSAGQVKLKWNAAMGASTYNVKRVPTSGGLWSSVATVAAPNVGYTDNSVVSGTSYYYKVSSINGAGESSDSPQLTVTVP